MGFLGFLITLTGFSLYQYLQYLYGDLEHRVKDGAQSAREAGVEAAKLAAEVATTSLASVRFAIMYNDIAVEMWQLSRAIRAGAPSSPTDAKQADVHLRAGIGLLRDALKMELPKIDATDPRRTRVDMTLKNSLAYMLVDRDDPSAQDLQRALELSREVYEHRYDEEEENVRDNRIDTFIFVRLKARTELDAARRALDELREYKGINRDEAIKEYTEALDALARDQGGE